MWTENIGISKIKSLLNFYVDKHWKPNLTKRGYHGYEYKVIDDDFTELIGEFKNNAKVNYLI